MVIFGGKLMNRVDWLGSVSLSLVLGFVGACDGGDGDNDDAGNLDDFVGTWLITSITVDDAGTEVTSSRDGSPQSLRADARITGSGTSGSLRFRSLDLEDNLPTSAFEADTIAITAEDGKWILTDNSEATPIVSVYAIDGSQNEYVLTLDATDERHNDDEAAKEVVLSRLAGGGWGETMQGGFVVDSMTIDGSEVATGACNDIGGGEYEIMEIAMDFDADRFFEMAVVENTYSDNSCSTLSMEGGNTMIGFAEEEGSELRMWFWDDADQEGSYMDWNFASDAGKLTLTRISCAPADWCTNAPTAIVMTPQS
jgi:hypothetical protein